VNYFKKIFNVLCALLFSILILILVINSKINLQKHQSILPFSFNDKDISYNNDKDLNMDKVPVVKREDVINRAKAMVEVEWTPKYNIKNTDGNYTFKKGETYIGIPYTMDVYQVSSVSDFEAKIKTSKEIYGNDCSGFVSIAWGIARQTTLSIFNSLKSGSKLNGHLISQINWEDLKPGDALLRENGKGEGHIILYDNTDSKISDNLSIYEQNISITSNLKDLPVARKGVRSKVALKKYGYIPIRLQGLS